MNFSNKNVNINNLDFSIESNNLKTINLSSCDTSNLRNLSLDLKYFFKEDGDGLEDKVIGINGESSFNGNRKFKSDYITSCKF